MNAPNLKASLIKDKDFFKNLYEGEFILNRKTLQSAEDYKLKTLSWYLHFLSKGSIPLKKHVFEKIPFNLIKLLQKTFEKKSSCLKFLNFDRPMKLKILTKFAKCYSFLLYPLFNEEV